MGYQRDYQYLDKHGITFLSNDELSNTSGGLDLLQEIQDVPYHIANGASIIGNAVYDGAAYVGGAIYDGAAYVGGAIYDGAAYVGSGLVTCYDAVASGFKKLNNALGG